MIETRRIDQYVCIDVEKLIVDEMRDIVCTVDSPNAHPEDREYMAELRKAALVILSNYECQQ